MALFRSTNPATGVLQQTYDPLSPAALEERLHRSARAFEGHENTPLALRAARLRKAADVLDTHAAAYAALMTGEMGKPFAQAQAEVQKCAWVCRYYAEHGADFLAAETVATDAAKSYVAYQPLGAILAIMPWNFPFWQVFRFAAPALMAGNVALLKHAPNVPGCAEQIEQVFQAAGFGDAFLNLFIDHATAAEVIADDRVQAVTLTGSERAGRAVAAVAGQALKKTVLELGGSDPFIVLADADLEAAVTVGISSRTLNNGQSCIAAKRFIVERPVAAAFTDALVHRMAALRIGDPMAPDTQIGPLARADLREMLHHQVQRTIEQGATLRTGGQPLTGPGFFYAPTVLTNVQPGQVAFEEELFGPVAAVTVADDADHALALANQTRYGLGGALFTRDTARGEAFAHRLHVGGAFVNGMVKSDPRLPFGGTKASGYGRELARHGLLEFVNAKTIWVGQ